MSNLNRIVLVGTVADKPDTKFGMENNSSMAKFTLNVDRPARQDGVVEQDAIAIISWGKSADYVAEYLQQGSVVIVEGRIQTRSSENNGQRVYTTEVSATAIKSINKTASPAVASSPAPTISDNPFDSAPAESTVDDVPF